MTELNTFLGKLTSLDIKLRVVGGELKINAPKGALTPDLITELKSRKQDLITFLAETSGSSPSRVPEIGPAPKGPDLPLSFSQQRLWFIDQMEEHQTAVYNVPALLRLDGDLNREILERCFVAMAQRHEVLRTCFVPDDGKARLLIRDQPEIKIAYTDHSSLPEEKRAICLEQSMQQECGFFFDLEQGPLIRIALFREQAYSHLMTVVMHHIISDGWSIGVMVQEFAALYEAFVEDKADPLPPLPIQYSDFAWWQRHVVGEGFLKKKLEFWKVHLEGSPQLLELPTDFPRPSVQGFKGKKHYFTIQPELTKRLNALARNANATLFMTLHAAFSVFLARMSGQTDVVVGTPVANRTRRILETLIGFFVNTLVLRCRVAGRPTFLELLQRVKQDDLAAFDHQDVPFDLVVEALQPERNLSHSPIFQTMFAFQNMPDQTLRLPGLTISPIEPEHTAARVDFSLEMSEEDGGISATFEYCTDLFETETMEQWSGYFIHLLTAIVDRPQTTVDVLPLLDDARKTALLHEWNQTEDEFESVCIHQLFEQKALMHPDAEAIVDAGNERMTYGVLARKAHTLANYLISLGAGPERFVAIRMQRSSDLAVAVLAVLSSGSAFVAIAVDHPDERVAMILEEVDAVAMISDSDTTCNIPVLDIRRPTWDHYSDQNPAIPLSKANLAYAMFTSGSTGRPKGVMISHGGIANRFIWAANAFPLNREDRFLQVASFVFDISLWEMFAAWLAGATTVMAPIDAYGNPSALLRFMASEKITVAHFVPTLLDVLLQESELDLARDLRMIFVGGEAVTADLCRRCLDLLDVSLFQFYGPTEASINVTSYDVGRGFGHKVPLGGPIANTRIHLLDENMSPAVVGVYGHLHIGGHSLARGYLANPGMTAAAFVPNPYSNNGERLYRTGDQARYDRKGLIEFLGRRDHQHKIRGFRIELGEIEAALNSLEPVREAAVLVREDRPNVKRLIAWFTSYVEPAPDAAALRAMLAKKLPDYMVPSLFLHLDEMPLGSTGKLDRKALVVPEGAAVAANNIPPVTEVEKTLAEIWARVLGLEQVGIQSNFFELGGDSILSIQIVARAREAGIHLAPKQIFEYQTIAELASVADSANLIRAEQGPVTGEAPLTPIQHYFFETNGSHHFNQALLFSISPELTPDILQSAITALIEHHDALRMRYDKTVPNQYNAGPPETAPVTVLTFPEDHAARASFIEDEATRVQSSLDLEQGPIFHAVLFQPPQGLSDQDGRLLLVIHHLVVDGVSWRILLEDLQIAFSRLQQGEDLRLPPKTTSFKEWAGRLAAYGPELAGTTEKDFWLTPARREVLGLPRDLHGGAETNTVASTAHVEVSMDPARTDSLLKEAGLAYNTRINDLLLTALAETLAQWTGASSCLIDLESHGREDLFDDMDVSRTVGWFTALYPLLLEVGESPEANIKAVKEQIRAVPRSGIGYGLLRYLGPDNLRAELTSLPAAEVVFNYLGQTDQVLESGSLLGAATESAGPMREGDQARDHLLDISAVISEGQLCVTWSYSRNVHLPATVEHLAGDYMARLNNLLTHCLSPENGGHTPSDFPLAAIDQSSMDRLLMDRKSVRNLYPLAPMQSGMLYHSAMSASDEDIYYGIFHCCFQGDLKQELFRDAWKKMVERYDNMRTSFHWNDLDRPLQMVHGEPEMPWVEEDWSHLSAVQQQERKTAFLGDDKQTGFHLDHAPLMRWSLFRLGPDSWWFAWSQHLLTMDGWSLATLFREFYSLYESMYRNQSPTLPPVRPYSDHIAWLETRDRKETERFWRDVLADFDTPTSALLPGFQPSDSDNAYHEKERVLSESLSNGLQAFLRQSRLTLSTLIQAAWARILGYHSGRSDVVFGTTVSGRPSALEGVENMVGVFINTLPARIHIDESSSFLEWLADNQDNHMARDQHSFTPLAEVQRWSGVAAGLPLFDSLVVVENYPLDATLASEERVLAVSEIETIERTNYPLTFSVIPGARILLKLGYDRNSAHDELADTILTLVSSLLEHAVNLEKTALVSDWSIKLPEHQLATVTGWGRNPRAYPEAPCLPALISACARKNPGAPAVSDADGALDFSTFQDKATRMARSLRVHGVKPGVLVAVYLDRNTDLITCLYGIMLAGGTYLPLDIMDPIDRTHYALDDSKTSLVITSETLKPRLNSIAVPVVEPGELQNETTAELPEIDPLYPAYVIYTSGSTGKPKGVSISHRALLDMTQGHIDYYRLTSEDRATQLARIAFDASVFEIWPCLAAGGSVHMTPAELIASPEALQEWLVAREITTSFVPTPVAELLIQLPWPKETRLHTLFTGGDRLSRYPTADLPFRLVNNYGPTEGTVAVTVGDVSFENQSNRAPDIGRPTANSEIYMMGRHFEPTPPGGQGELCIGGPGLANGYLYRPAMTAERFVPNPFAEASSAGSRLYRTGDLACFDAEGRVHFQGRIDHQLKLRGFRIELGEIENCLRELPDVKDATVLVTTHDSVGKQLIGYVTVTSENVDGAVLRNALTEKLPAHMVPAAIMIIDAFPLTPNGKLDRHALPKPEITTGEYQAPQTETENALVVIWAQILGLTPESISRDHHFFDLGGHSLLIMKVVSRVKQKYGIQLTMEQAFQNATVQELAAHIDKVSKLLESIQDNEDDWDEDEDEEEFEL